MNSFNILYECQFLNDSLEVFIMSVLTLTRAEKDSILIHGHYFTDDLVMSKGVSFDSNIYKLNSDKTDIESKILNLDDYFTFRNNICFFKGFLVLGNMLFIFLTSGQAGSLSVKLLEMIYVLPLQPPLHLSRTLQSLHS